LYAIEASGLTKSFRRVRAVDGVDLLVEEGEVVAVLGPNGAGKTTTLMMLLGIVEPDGGRIDLLGHRLPGGRRAALQESNFTASYVGMPDQIRIREILGVFADLYGAPPGRVDELVDLFGLGPLLRRFTSQISSGQRTLVGLAKALLNRPKLLILDEPTASLDPEIGARVREILLDVHAREGVTVLVTSHNMRDIERLCRRVVFLAGGRIVADGTAEEIAERYGAADLEASFLEIAAETRR
jgi:ABC-2 type transport system ATP-binding protein